MRTNPRTIELKLDVLRLMRARLLQYILRQESDFSECVWFFSDGEAVMEIAMLRFRIIWLQSFWEVIEQIGDSRRAINKEFTDDDWVAAKDVYDNLLQCFMHQSNYSSALIALNRENLAAMRLGLDEVLERSHDFDERLRVLRINQQKSRVIFRRKLEQAKQAQ